MSLTEQELLRVAALAELDVPAAELGPLATQLDAIVAYVGQLAQLAADQGFSPLVAGPSQTPLRLDEVRPVPLARPPGELAPEFADGFFVVPRLPAMEES